MKYACLVYGEEAKIATVPDRECMANGDSLRASGRYLGGEALQPVRVTKTVRVRDGRRLVTDGPFTEAKEYLAGFYLVEAATIDEAIEIASKIPPARVGHIEVRPVRELVP